MVSSIQSKLISTQEMKSGIQESKKTLKEIEVKDGTRKLALTLGALGAVGMATVFAIKKGNIAHIKDAATKVPADVKEIVLKKSKRFTPESTSYITKVGSDGKAKTFLCERGTITNPNFRNGKTISIKKVTDLTTGKMSSVQKIEKCVIQPEIVDIGTLKLDSKVLTHDSMICRLAGPQSPDIKLGHVVLPNGKKTLSTYSSIDATICDANHNFLRTEKHNRLRSIIDSSFDKKTGILTQTERFCHKTENGISDSNFFRTYLTNPKTGNTICFDSDAFSPENIFANIEIGNTKGISGVNLGYHGSNIFEDLKNALTSTKNPITSDTALLDELKKYMK